MGASTSSRRVLAGLIVLVGAATGAAAEPLSSSALSTGRTVEHQLARLHHYWPRQFAVILVEVAGPPTRLIQEGGMSPPGASTRRPAHPTRR